MKRWVYAVIIALLVNIIVIAPADVCAVRGGYQTEGQLIARFHTRYNVRNSNRSHNIAVASAKISGTIVSPNKAVSFNELTGARTAENGYKEARIIYDGEYVPGFGGGVCQVSTTLYNALLTAGMVICEVHPHTIRPDYVPCSRDAMVSYGDFDLVFQNPYPSPIVIYMSAKEGDLTADIYGAQKPAGELKLISEVYQEIPPPPAEIIFDHQGLYQDKVIFKDESFALVNEKNGARSRLYAERKIGDRTERIKLREDYYLPLRAKIVFGTL